LGDQFAMPSEQGFGRHNGGHFRQKLPSQTFGSGGQSTALVVVEPQAPAELLSQKRFSS